jgi:hypothetical protein
MAKLKDFINGIRTGDAKLCRCEGLQELKYARVCISAELKADSLQKRKAALF